MCHKSGQTNFLLHAVINQNLLPGYKELKMLSHKHVNKKVKESLPLKMYAPDRHNTVLGLHIAFEE